MLSSTWRVVKRRCARNMGVWSAMSINAKYNLFFETSGGAGWSETYYHEDTDIEVSYNKCILLAQQRAKLLAANVTLSYIRVSDTQVTGDAFAGTVEGLTNGLAERGSTDMPWSGVLCRVEAGARHRRMFCLRGIPDLLQSYQLPVPQNPEVTKPIRAFGQYLVQQGYLMRVASRGFENPSKPISGFDVTTTPWVLTCPAHGFVTGDRVKISNAKTSPSINGTWWITVASVDTFKLNGTEAYGPGSVFYTGGYATKQEERFLEIGDFQPIRYSSRRVGRPFGAPVGRRRRR